MIFYIILILLIIFAFKGGGILSSNEKKQKGVVKDGNTKGRPLNEETKTVKLSSDEKFPNLYKDFRGDIKNYLNNLDKNKDGSVDDTDLKIYWGKDVFARKIAKKIEDNIKDNGNIDQASILKEMILITDNFESRAQKTTLLTGYEIGLLIYKEWVEIDDNYDFHEVLEDFDMQALKQHFESYLLSYKG